MKKESLGEIRIMIGKRKVERDFFAPNESGGEFNPSSPKCAWLRAIQILCY